MKRFLMSLAAGFAALVLNGQQTFNNPIIPGFHPDPSICRVGEDFYLVTSSFEWFPGIPVYHSRDLMNWEQIGHVLTRPSQLALNEGMKHSRGLWAPTIRYNEGLFYVICTAQDAGGTFYVTAKSPYGPWSEPVFLKDAPGIDPSLFFDDNGKCWFTATVNGTPELDRYLHEDRVYLQELNLSEGKLVGPRQTICTGHAVNAPYAEAPHIYKIGKTYYLLIAEGGTWEDHAVTIFTSDKVTGPYTAGITNPVLTHRFLGKNVDITTVGHADLVQDTNGRWWAVMLGVRPIEGYNMLGRETFITPVEFQDGWPVFNPGIGRVLMEEKSTGLKPCPFTPEPARDEFDSGELAFCWNFLRTPYTKWYELKNGVLRIKLRKESVSELVNPSLIARRIDKFDYTAQTEVKFKPSANGEEAGLIVMQNAYNNYRLVKERRGGKNVITLYKTERGKTLEVASIPSSSPQACLKVVSEGLIYRFFAGDDSSHLQALGGMQDASINSTQKAGGFIGPFIGMYASSNGKKSSNYADFDYFEYSDLEEGCFTTLTGQNHPRLVMDKAAFETVASQRQTNPNLDFFHNLILRIADESIGNEPLEFHLDAAGKRILGISRDALFELINCSYAFRATGDEKYLDQAVRQLDAVCSFPSWNAERHFLDTGEMATAVAFAYDWMYDALPVEIKEKAVRAIREFAFKPVLTGRTTHFFKTEGNWEQVCCGGLLCAALSIYETCPQEAQEIIRRCVLSNREVAPKLFGPDGNYPEGYGYWGYGTMFQTLINVCLESVLGEDNYSLIAGLDKTGRYIKMMEGPAGYSFCYADTSPSRLNIASPLWYFAAKAEDPSIVSNELGKVQCGMYTSTNKELRLLPTLMPYIARIDCKKANNVPDRLYVGQGKTPVIAGRTSWTGLISDKDAYFGFKGGKAAENHGHLDAGSFVFDADGERWALDFTRPSYTKMENALGALGGSFWDGRPQSLRWRINVMNNICHNTLTVNGADHLVDGMATVISCFDKPGAIGGTMDITAPLGKELARAVRTVKIVGDGQTLVVVDSVTALPQKDAEIEWRMMTEADAEAGSDAINLTLNGKHRVLSVSGGNGAILTTFSLEKVHDYDSDLRKFNAVGWKATLPAGTSAVYTTTLSR